MTTPTLEARPRTVPPRLAVPPRPARPLPTLQLLKTAATDTIGIFDEELFDEPVIVRRHGPVSMAFVSDPAGIKRVLVDNAANYPSFRQLRRLYAPEIGTGTLATDGELWRRHRRIAAPTLDRRATAPDVPGLIASAEAEVAALGDGMGDAPINIEAWVARLWVTLLNRMATGGDPRGLPILAWLAKVPRKMRLLDLVPLPDWLANLVSPAKQSPERAALRGQLLAMVEERLQEGYAGPRDLLWRIAHATDRETGQALPLDEMRDEASSLIAAGDASIRALTWIWYLLALHPDVERRMHAELDEVLGDRALEPDQIKLLPYTRRVLDEVMRLYPPVPTILRRAKGPDTVCGHRVPRNAIVAMMPWIVHRHRRLWTDPDTFDPDRFTEERSRGRSRYAYIPFSVGPRVCSGASFAITQITIIVVALARRYRFHLAPDRPVVPFGGISLQPRGGLWVTPEPRRT